MFSNIRKKPLPQNLKPLRINTVELNSQQLLLQSMNRLISEQRQSNRLLKKIAGQIHGQDNLNQNSKISIYSSPRKINLSEIITSPVGKQNHSPPRPKQYVDYEFDDRSLVFKSQINKESNFSPSPNRASQHQTIQHQNCHCDNSELTQTMKGLENVLKSIEKHLAKTNEQKIQPFNPIKKVERTETDVHANVEKRMQSSLGFKAQISGSPAKKEKEEKIEDFNIFEAKSISKKKIDLNLFSKFNTKHKNQRQPKLQKRESNFQNNLVEQMFNYGAQNQQQLEQKKNYSVLSEILPYSDRRQIKIKISHAEVIEYYKSKGEIVDTMKATQEWLGMVYRATASICWNMLSNSLLTFDETKILFTQNIIYNFIEFTRTYKDSNCQIQRSELVQNINNTAVSILDFLCTQYPQTKVEDPNIALRSQIPSIDNKGRVKFDFISRISKDKVVTLKKKKNGDYTSDIMRVINYMIDKSNEQFNDFNDLMSNIFGEIFMPIQKRRSTEKTEETHEDHIYFEKVKSYSKVLIGRKISKNTPKYTQPEIQNGVFFVKSPSILRIITKWVEQLDQIVRKPETQIKNANKQFKDHDGIPIHLYGQVKNALHKAIKQNRQKFNDRVRSIKRECYNLEVLLTFDKFTTDPDQIHLSEEQISVGKYCTYLKSAIASYICSELNELIDFLLEIPTTIDETNIGIADPYYQQQSKKDLDSLNLVNFKIFDLLRCKCISKESEIIYLLRRLYEKSNDNDDPFKIIRIKDRLSMGTRDILINAQINKGLVCEIQLGVTANIQKKQQLLDQYNHFLYQLKRAKLGSITQSASIWSALEQRAKFFQSQVKKDIIASNGQKLHPCINDFRKTQNRKWIQFSRPIICASCNNFFELPKTCLSNIKCEHCNDTYCGQCHLQHLKQEEGKQFVLEKPLFRYLFPYLKQWKDISKPFPETGFLIRKKYLKKELFYFRVIKQTNRETENKEQIKIELVISGVENGELVNKTINKKQIQAKLIDGKMYLDESLKGELNDYLIYEINSGKNIEKGTLSYKQLQANFNQQKLKYVNLLKHPTYIDDLRIVKKLKQIKKQMSNFSTLFNDDTAITYIKISKTVYILQVEVEEQTLQKELIKLVNIQRLKNFATEKVNSVSMEFRDVTDEMDLISTKFTPESMASFSKRVTKLYLSFGMVKCVKFLSILPNIKVLFLRKNNIVSLEGLQFLKGLLVFCFDNNQVSDLQPIKDLTNLTIISGIENQITNIDCIKKMTKLKKINFYNNQIETVEGLEEFSNLRQLSVNFNPLKKLEGIYNLTNLDELNLGKTLLSSYNQIEVFKNIRKLSLNDLKLKEIGVIFRNFDFLLKLNLSNNQIEKIENLDEMTELTQLNLRNNKIKVIENLENCGKLEYIKISQNYITDVSGIRTLDNLKLLKIENNPLNDVTDFYYMNKKYFKIIYTAPESAIIPEWQPTQGFYEKYKAVDEHRVSSSSGSNEDSCQEEF